MVEFFKTVDGRITEVSEFTEGCWVNMVHPSSDELEQIAQAAQVEEEFVRAALDPEESSRVDTEDEQLLMIVDIPMVEKSSVETADRCSPPFLWVLSWRRMRSSRFVWRTASSCAPSRKVR